MEENKGLEMGVEDTSVANLETEEVANTQEVVQEQPDKEVVEQPTDSKEPVESKFDKAFSKRLSKAQEKIRQEVATEYEAKLSKFERVLQHGAKENDVPLEEYVDALLEQYGENQEQGKPVLDSETMELLQELKAEKTTKELESEKSNYWNRQAKQLLEIGVKDLSDIPQEVLERALENDTEIAFE